VTAAEPVDAATPPALAGLRVVDLSDGVAGQYCAKLLSSYGAETLLVEKEGGTATRRLPPLLNGESVLFRHLNQGKTATTVDAAELVALLEAADVVIHDQNFPEPLALDPTVVECVIGEFPRGSAYADWQGSEMIHQALSGTMFATGRPDREPLYGLGYRAYYACGTTACASVLAALYERANSGLGQMVEATVFESLAAIAQNLISQYSYTGTFETRHRYPGYLAVLRCRDSWIVLFAVRSWQALIDVFDLPDLLEDPRLANPQTRLDHWDLVTERLQERATHMEGLATVEALQRNRVSAELVRTVEELISSPQWVARRMLRTVESKPGISEPALGPPFRIGSSAYVGLSPSPGPPTHAPDVDEVVQRWNTWAKHPRSRASTRRATPRIGAAGFGPLGSLRVLDFTTAWAGPFVTRSLAFLGAEVIKIDAPSHMDSWRGEVGGGAANRYPDRDAGVHPWNRCVLFNTQGQGKRSLGLDLKMPGGVETLLDLARTADIVVTNFSPGVLDRLGVGYAALNAVNPVIIVVEMPAFGPGGPDSAHQGMGKTMEAACGMATLMGYGDGVPTLTGPAYLDPIGGLNAVAATLIALYRRTTTGLGCRVEVPQTEAAAHWIGEFVWEQVLTGHTWTPQGNAAPGYAPHGAFPCRGDDNWIAIAVANDEQWRTLCLLIGDKRLSEDTRLVDHDGRRTHAELINAVLSEWTVGEDKHDLAARLQRAGVPAAPVNNGADVARDEVLQAIGFIKYLDHPEAGRHAYPTLSYILRATPGDIRSAAPCFGADNRSILTDILGYPEERIAALYAAGAIADVPKGALQ
jgi:crotonobetainyl-CoA:carnitine CoA-transferase CaiB-like acyl-CoA transferase